MEGPYLPEGSGGEQPPEEPKELVGEELTGAIERAAVVYNARMLLFEEQANRKPRKRRSMNDYRTKNCEEAWGSDGS